MPLTFQYILVLKRIHKRQNRVIIGNIGVRKESRFSVLAFRFLNLRIYGFKTSLEDSTCLTWKFV